MGEAAPGGRDTGAGQRLRRERLRRNLTQEMLAELLGATVRSVRRWESGRALPQPDYRAAYCRVFGLAGDVLFGSPGDGGASRSDAIFLVPHARNPFFTGREDVLGELGEALGSSRAVALCGIGGVGKTQVAVEYVHRFREHYVDVLWVSADGSSDMRASLAGAALALALPEASESNRATVEAGIRRWLAANRDWLLVLDNVDHPALLGEWLPATRQGRLLVTCRYQATGTLAHAIPVPAMAPADSLEFLVRRAKLLRSSALQSGVAEIAEAMGGLPLALDQAGAYMEETGATPSEYLELFRVRRQTLLQRRGIAVADHPDSVATTIRLSLDELRQANPDAASLLSLCAFLHPNDIPEDLFGDPYLLAEAVASLRSFSLVQRHPDSGTFTVHRLVQDVLRDEQLPEERRHAAERAVALMAGAFARADGIATWADRHRLFSHALTTARLATDLGLATPETGELLGRTGSYLQTLGQPGEAMGFLERALVIAEGCRGPEHPEVARCLNALGSLHQDLGAYERAESLLRRSLTVWERAPGRYDLEAAQVLNDLGTLYVRQGRYREGEAAHLRVLEILEGLQGPEHPWTGVTLNNLGGHAHMAGRYADAECYFQRSLAFRRRVLGPEHPTVATVLSNLGALAFDMGRLDDAVPLLLEAERIYRLAFGGEHWAMGKAIHHRALVLQRQGELDRADEVLQEALALLRRKLGEDHPRVAQALSDLARLRDDQGRHEEAEAMHERAIGIQERALGARHPDLAASLHNLALHHGRLGRREVALATGERAYEIRCAMLGPEHPRTLATREMLCAMREEPF